MCITSWDQGSKQGGKEQIYLHKATFRQQQCHHQAGGQKQNIMGITSLIQKYLKQNQSHKD